MAVPSSRLQPPQARATRSAVAATNGLHKLTHVLIVHPPHCFSLPKAPPATMSTLTRMQNTILRTIAGNRAAITAHRHEAFRESKRCGLQVYFQLVQLRPSSRLACKKRNGLPQASIESSNRSPGLATRIDCVGGVCVTSKRNRHCSRTQTAHTLHT